MPSLILSDNGVSSGSAGLKTTAASDGSLALQTSTAGGAATTAVTIDTSQNVGIGTGSPSSLAANYTTVDIRGATGGALRFGNATDSSYIYSDSNETNIATATNKRMIFSINTAEKMRLDTSGNLGLGVTPSAWASGAKAIQVGSYASLYEQTGAVVVGNNFYNITGGSRYLNTAAATAYVQETGKHIWYNAPSGTAGNAITFTQAMTLDASGRLLVGTTGDVSAGGYFGAGQFRGSYPALVISGTETSARTWQIGENAGSLTFYDTTGGERARIDSSGNFGVGTSSPATKLDVSGTATATSYSSGLGGTTASLAPGASQTILTVADYSMYLVYGGGVGNTSAMGLALAQTNGGGTTTITQLSGVATGFTVSASGNNIQITNNTATQAYRWKAIQLINMNT